MFGVSTGVQRIFFRSADQPGTLRSNYDNGNEHVKKALSLIRKTAVNSVRV